CGALDQRQQRLAKPRLTLTDRRASRARTTNPALRRALPTLHLSDPPTHRRLGDIRRAHHRRDPPTTMRTRLRRRPDPAGALIELVTNQQPPLPNAALVD